MKLTHEQAETLDTLEQFVLPERQPGDIDAQQYAKRFKLLSNTGSHNRLKKLVKLGIMTEHEVRDPALGGRVRVVYRLSPICENVSESET